jgi:hypothetical protein
LRRGRKARDRTRERARERREQEEREARAHALAHEPLLTAVKERFGSIEDRLFKSGIGAGRRRFRQPRQRRTDRYGRREREASCASQPPRGRTHQASNRTPRTTRQQADRADLANASGAKTREQAIREIACDLKIRAQVIALKRLAQETAEIYDELIRCKTPPELVRGYFLVSKLCERIDEEQRGERLR